MKKKHFSSWREAVLLGYGIAGLMVGIITLTDAMHRLIEDPLLSALSGVICMAVGMLMMISAPKIEWPE